MKHYTGSTSFISADLQRAYTTTPIPSHRSAILAQGVTVNFEKIPHILVAGATGNGKSVLMHGIVLSLMYNTLPSEAQFIFIDPKMVEFNRYRSAHHLFCDPVTDLDGAIPALQEAERIMFERYHELKDQGEEQWTGTHLFVVVDEIAELIFKSEHEAIALLSSIARLGRAAGVHLICATQLPSRSVLSNQVAMNFECRVCLMCENPVDYRTILGTMPSVIPDRIGMCVMRCHGKETVFQAPLVTKQDYLHFVETCTVTGEDQPETPNKKAGFLSLLGCLF